MFRRLRDPNAEDDIDASLAVVFFHVPFHSSFYFDFCFQSHQRSDHFFDLSEICVKSCSIFDLISNNEVCTCTCFFLHYYRYGNHFIAITAEYRENDFVKNIWCSASPIPRWWDFKSYTIADNEKFQNSIKILKCWKKSWWAVNSEQYLKENLPGATASTIIACEIKF